MQIRHPFLETNQTRSFQNSLSTRGSNSALPSLWPSSLASHKSLSASTSNTTAITARLAKIPMTRDERGTAIKPNTTKSEPVFYLHTNDPLKRKTWGRESLRRWKASRAFENEIVNCWNFLTFVTVLRIWLKLTIQMMLLGTMRLPLVDLGMSLFRCLVKLCGVIYCEPHRVACFKASLFIGLAVPALITE